MSLSPYCTLEDRSRDLAATVRSRLTAFCAQPLMHARFLNTLSLLEHIGSRKIMASQGRAAWDSGMLKHMAEETRHAFFFKRLAEKLARRPLDYSAGDTLAGASAKAYMGRLDADVTRETERTGELPYLCMSLIVELRAVWLYRLYQAVLEEHAPGLSLKSVLAEEDLHLSAMSARLSKVDSNAVTRIAAFSTTEDARFRTFWSAIGHSASTTVAT